MTRYEAAGLIFIGFIVLGVLVAGFALGWLLAVVL